MVELSFLRGWLRPFFLADFSCKLKCLTVICWLSEKFVFNVKVRLRRDFHIEI